MDPKAFAGTLQSILRVASNGARMVYRSTVRNLPPPPEVAGMLIGEPELAERLLQSDRSGVYSGFYVYRVASNTLAS